ncbi:sensor histidine kinase [Streptomyces cinnamoneus]|uniref:sensor histidine kinase n=1 Tax=Streptomyces cinnamoneus TaxID=53446 RepID=UPI001E38E2DA|nr:ATP-binding protein [Streptomyces cinnamoneus]
MRSAGGHGRAREGGGLWLLLAGVVALAAGIAGGWAYARAGASGPDVVRDVTVGWAFAGAGLVARWRRPANRTGQLMVAEGLTWFLGNLQGTSVPVLFAVGAWGEALNLAVLAHLFLAFPDGRLTTPLTRRVVVSSYVLVAVGGLLRVLTYDPSLDGSATYLTCGACGPNAFLVHRDPALFEAIDLVYRWVGAGLTVVTVVALIRSWRASCRARRRALMPAWISVVVASSLVGWEVFYVLAPGLLGPGEEAVALLSDLSEIAVPLAFLVGLLRMRLRRSAVGNVVIEVGADPTPRRLQDVLGRLLGDPSLRLGLWADEARAYLDPDGRPLRHTRPGAGLSVTPVGSPGSPSAILVHDATFDDDRELLAAVGASVRLCLENTWLRSEAAMRVRESRAVNSRILEAADRERQQLERDLHDGAQTRLVFALMALRRLDAGLSDSSDARLRNAVAETDRTLRMALEDLRGIARGIHPAVLTREGLGPAVTALAEQAEVPVVVSVEPRRYAPLTESTAYFAVCEALTNAAKYARAGAVRVSARHDDGWLVVEVADDGVGGADPARGTGLRGLADRLAALGGALRVTSPVGGGTRVRVELPCA